MATNFCSNESQNQNETPKQSNKDDNPQCFIAQSCIQNDIDPNSMHVDNNLCENPNYLDPKDNQNFRCKFYHLKKQRTCNFLAIPETDYCGLHLAESINDSASSYQRIPCPYDPNHTVYTDKLEKHLKKCNARPKPKPAYFSANINSGILGYCPCYEETITLNEFGEEYIKSIILRVNAAFNTYIGKVEENYLSHPILDFELKSPKNGATARKHLHQQSSLIGHIHGLLSILQSNKMVLVELGAGRGKLSHWVQKSFHDSIQDNLAMVLVDRAACRYKYDIHHKDGPQGSSKFTRLFIDIEHLDLSKVQQITDVTCTSGGSVLGYTKHLCGSATDFAIRCLTALIPQKQNFEAKLNEVNNTLLGIVMATCCHHKCTWPAYIGKEFFSDILNFTSLDFYAITLITSWKTCGMSSRLKTSDTNPNDGIFANNDDFNYKLNFSIKDWPITFMEQIGYQCKKLIDYGRIHWMKSMGITTTLCAYVSEDVTIENTAIIGYLTRDQKSI